ncbi:MAG: hypothetical protein H6887_18990, partial [Hoeflea sp.]|nr:hypothetical protein [Hoeflea sp.]
LAAAGFASGAFGSDIYRLAIAVTAISLLVSPIWFNLMERVEELANEGLGSYREALAQAYEGELDGVENVMWALRARYRAARFALYQRRARKSAARAEAGDSAVPAAGPQPAAETAGADVDGDPGKTPPSPSINQATADPVDDNGSPAGEPTEKGTA